MFAKVLACDGARCADSARILGLAAPWVFVVANGLVWVQYVLVAWSVYPAIFRALEATERLARERWRLAGAAAVVVACFAGWGFLAAAGSLLVYRAFGRDAGAAPLALVFYFAGLAFWNAFLFRGRAPAGRSARNVKQHQSPTVGFRAIPDVA